MFQAMKGRTYVQCLPFHIFRAMLSTTSSTSWDLNFDKGLAFDLEDSSAKHAQRPLGQEDAIFKLHVSQPTTLHHFQDK